MLFKLDVISWDINKKKYFFLHLLCSYYYYDNKNWRPVKLVLTNLVAQKGQYMNVFYYYLDVTVSDLEDQNHIDKLNGFGWNLKLYKTWVLQNECLIHVGYILNTLARYLPIHIRYTETMSVF